MRPSPVRPTRILAALAGLCLAGLGFSGLVLAAAPPAPRAVLLTVPADVPDAMLGEAFTAKIGVRALVAPSGLVDSTAAVDGDERLRASAETAVRWWVFAPARTAGWTTVSVSIEGHDDDEPLRPDVLALASQAETAGDDATALAALTGALARHGMSPTVNNDWGVRERALVINKRRPALYPPGDELVGIAQVARGEQLRTVTRVGHAALVAQFDKVVTGAPWWDEPYLWRAGSLAGTGNTAEALRSLRAFRLGTRDSAASVFAARLIDRLAAADTLGVSAAIKTWRVPADPKEH
jgi:hypothetical protein